MILPFEAFFGSKNNKINFALIALFAFADRTRGKRVRLAPPPPPALPRHQFTRAVLKLEERILGAYGVETGLASLVVWRGGRRQTFRRLPSLLASGYNRGVNLSTDEALETLISSCTMRESVKISNASYVDQFTPHLRPPAQT